MVYLRGIIMKTKSLRLLVLPLMFGFTGCDGGTFIACISNETKTGFTKEYHSFDGTCTYKREFAKAQTISVDIKSTDGTLVFTIKETNNDKEIYSGNFDKDTEITAFTVNADASKYEFKFVGTKHSGHFKVSYADKN